MGLGDALGLGPAQTNKTRITILRGTIGNPVPTSLSDLVTVLPQDSPANGIGPMKWIPCQGTTLPAYGDEAVVVFDQNYTPLCIWFDGVYSVPASVGGSIDGGNSSTSAA